MNRRDFIIGLGAAAGLVAVEPVRRIWQVGAQLSRPSRHGVITSVILNGVEYDTIPAADFSLECSSDGKAWSPVSPVDIQVDDPLRTLEGCAEFVPMSDEAEFLERVAREFGASPDGRAAAYIEAHNPVTPETIKAHMVEQMREWERRGWIANADELAASYTVERDHDDPRRVIESYVLPQFKGLASAITFKT